MVSQRRGIIAVLLAISVLSISTVPTYAIGGKVSLSPDNATLIEGGASQDFTIQLDAPIIVSMGNPKNYLDLNITSSDPSRITISPNPVVYLPSEWTQTKTLTISALNNAVYGDNETVNLTITADSGAAYYDGYTVTLPINITDSTPAPTPTVKAATVITNHTTPNAPDTGYGNSTTNNFKTLLEYGMIALNLFTLSFISLKYIVK